jgi:hypothetical protein
MLRRKGNNRKAFDRIRNSMMKTRTINVMEENWDYLIILDACRYDYFRDMYQDYFSGILESRLSVGSCTLEWCMKSFPKMYSDVIFISSNPYINSKTEIEGFDARKHFCSVIDVWAFGWNKKLGTVLPEKLNESALKATKNFPEKRFIVHYLQPHGPYISPKFRAKGFPTQDVINKKVLRGLQNPRGNKIVDRFVTIIAVVLSKLGLVKNSWKLREILKLQPATPMDAVRRIYGTEGLKEAYKQNLRIVLSSVAELCSKLLQQEPSRDIIITADHGESLGENGIYSHSYGSKNPVLLKVPWFKVTKVKKSIQPPKTVKQNSKSRLKDRIKKLKKRHELSGTRKN